MNTIIDIYVICITLMLKLTMHLYSKRFAEISFMESIISKQKLSCSLFWIYELYNSGFEEDTFELLYECYFYFYAMHNYSFINVIHKQYENWQKTGDVYIIGKLVKNLKHKAFSLDIFKLKIEMDKQEKSRIKRYKKEAWESKYGKYGIILRYLHRKDYKIMVSRIKNIPQNEMGIFTDFVIKYFVSKGVNIKKYNAMIEYLDTTHPFIYLYLIYVIMILDTNQIQHERKIIASLCKSEKELIDSFNHDDSERHFKILKNHRLHEVASDFITLFNVNFQHMNILEETRSNWKEHVKETPFWMDKNLDEYDLEYDEQSLRCQELSVLKPSGKKMDTILEQYSF